MLEKLQDFLDKHMHKDYSFIITFCVYTMIVFTLLFTIGYLFNFIPFIIISIFTFERIRFYSGGFHMKDNVSCFLFTTPLFITFAYILAQNSTDYLWVVFFICLICMRDLYHKVPLIYCDTEPKDRWYNCRPFIYIKMNRNKLDSIVYDKKWHRKRALFWIAISYLLAILFFTLNLELLCSYTLWLIIMADLLMFKNID